MPIDLRLEPADVLGIRFARSPMWETMQALRTVREPGRHAYHLSWLRSLDLAALAPASTVLAPLVPVRGFQPDFLIPIPEGPTGVFADELAAVRATPRDVVVAELERCAAHPRTRPDTAAAVRALAADPDRAVEMIVAAQRTCWEVLVRPFWNEIDDLLAADIAHRAARLACGGIADVLATLHPDVSWSGDALVVQRGHGQSDDLRGRGLVLMPSVFGWPMTATVSDPPWQPTVVYPARGVGTLWPPRARRDEGALGELVGASRARLLHLLDEERSTTALAQRLGLGLPTTSVHLRVLRAGGLVTARRDGREVLHRRTALGAALVGSGG